MTNDDTLERLKRKNTQLRGSLKKLVFENESTESGILDDAISQNIPVGHNMDQGTSDESYRGIHALRYPSDVNLRMSPSITIHNRFAGGKLDNKRTEERPFSGNQDSIDEFKRSIEEIRKSDYTLSLKDKGVKQKLKNLKLENYIDKVELKKLENMLLNKLQSQTSQIDVLKNTIRSLKEHNRTLSNQNYELLEKIEILEALQNSLDERYHEKVEKTKKDHDDKISSLSKKCDELATKLKVTDEERQILKDENANQYNALRDLTYNHILYKQALNEADAKVQSLIAVNNYLHSELVKSSSCTDDDTELLLQSTTVRLLNSSPQTKNYFTASCNFSKLPPKAKFRVLIYMIISVNRLRKKHYHKEAVRRHETPFFLGEG